MKNKLKNTALCIMNYALCIAMLLGATLLTGCQKDDSGLSNLADGTATFNVAVDNGVQTRSSDPTSPNPLPSRYIMEVYEVATPTTAISGTAQQRYEATTGSFSVVLKDGVNYACLFWADYGTKDGTDNEYNASDLKAVKIAKQATKEAFGGFVRFTYDSKASSTDKAKYLNVSLTHAVAQVNYKQIEAFTGTAADSLMVEFTKTFAVKDRRSVV